MDKPIKEMTVDELNALGYRAFKQKEQGQKAIEDAVGVINAIEAELVSREKKPEETKNE